MVDALLSWDKQVYELWGICGREGESLGCLQAFGSAL